MLSKRFTATEATAVSNEANNWIDFVDGEITKSVLNGENEVSINFCHYNKSTGCNEYNEIAKIWYSAPDFFKSHYAGRGFVLETNGQCSVIIKWGNKQNATKSN
jgi:hypothetical protein